MSVLPASAIACSSEHLLEAGVAGTVGAEAGAAGASLEDGESLEDDPPPKRKSSSRWRNCAWEGAAWRSRIMRHAMASRRATYCPEWVMTTSRRMSSSHRADIGLMDPNQLIER